MGDKVTVSRADIDSIIEDIRLGCYETAIKHLTAMLDAPAAAEPVAWQYRLLGREGATKWRECDEAVRAMIAETGHYNGVNKSPAELRPLYEGSGLTLDYTAAQLSDLLRERDNFIVSKGLWGDFVDSLPTSPSVSTPHSTAVSAIAQERDVGKWGQRAAHAMSDALCVLTQCGDEPGKPDLDRLHDELRELTAEWVINDWHTTSPSAISEAPTSAEAVTHNPPEVS